MAALEMRPAGALHDVELIVRAAEGDHAAFGELARRHVAPVRTLLVRLGATTTQAERLAQDAFLVAFEGIGDRYGEGAFGVWIKRIAARLYVKSGRSRLRLEPHPTDSGFDRGDVPTADGGVASDLDAALAMLSRSERLCVSLCFGAGLTHAEAAAAVGASGAAVKAQVRSGVAKLERALRTTDRTPVELS